MSQTLNHIACTATTRCRLFPYTTLFRSVLGVGHARCSTIRKQTRRERLGGPLRFPGTRRCCERPGSRPPRLYSSVAYQDRKSTRLNSSHLVISYAVLCLKKKIRRINIDP